MMHDEADFTLPPDWAAAVPPPAPALAEFLRVRAQAGAVIYPPAPLRFHALEATPLASVKAVILGQDPYHGPGQAHGLAFSVPPGVRPPPSLRNILRELETDLGLSRPRHGCLEAWAERGVLLLNGVLSVEAGLPNSHAGKGWEDFTRRVLRAVRDRPGHVAFVLWGAHAARLAGDIDGARHLAIRSAHPSPLAAHRGFLGSKPFSQVNRFLSGHGLAPIDWALPSSQPSAGIGDE